MNTEFLLKIFETWIADRLASYQEPSRKGTPKGSPIGFSKTKFYAANLMVLHELGFLPLAEIAKKVSTSHELIRKWRTEKKFQDHAYYAYSDFKEYIEDQALLCFDNWSPDCERYFAALDMFKWGSTFFKVKLTAKFLAKVKNKDLEQSIIDWVQFFNAYRIDLDTIEKQNIAKIDIEIMNIFITWLLSFIIHSNIDKSQKKLFGLLIKQLFPKVFNQWLSTQSFSE
jgi:hypothetical protein